LKNFLFQFIGSFSRCLNSYGRILKASLS